MVDAYRSYPSPFTDKNAVYQAMSNRRFFGILLIPLAGIFAWSAIRPHDYYTWALEVAPILIVLPLLWATHARFALTRLCYVLIFLHAIILIVGGHYTYALVPLGDWARDTFDLSRNHYDRLGHFAQGFIPAIVAREILLRLTPLERGKWLSFLVVSVCLAFSAFYELIEWWVAALSGTGAEAFLGTQGDVWDTQKDMMICTIGTIIALASLSKIHDRAINKLS